MSDAEKTIRANLFSLQDEKYRDFSSKLMPTVDKETVIGVRTPDLRKYAKNLSGTPEALEFLDILPHKYYEENNLHGFLIERIKDYDEVIERLEIFLPYIDNWATCDLISPKIFKKHKDELYIKIKEWIKTEKTYTVRFAVEMLMSLYLDDDFKTEYSDLVSTIKSEEYYVNMMTAWYFATALAKHYEEILPYIENNKLDKWTHNKAIQKAIESYRITDEQKAYLRTLKIK